MAKKSTDAEMEIRHATVAEMIVKGQSRQDILQYGSKEWNVSDRTIDSYIDAAWSKIKSSVDKDVDKQVQLALSRYEDLYKRSFQIQDYRECRQVQNDIVKLLGLAEAQKIDHVSSDGSMSPPSNLQELYDAEAESES